MTFINRSRHNNAINSDALIQYGAVKQRTDTVMVNVLFVYGLLLLSKQFPF